MALDLSQYTATTDSPEITAFKEKVRTISMAYARKNNWCDEVRKALKEMGIEDERQVTIKVVTSHPFEFSVKVLPSALVNLTEDQQKARLAESIGEVTPMTYGAAKVTSVKMTIAPAQIVTMELVTKAARGTLTPIPEGDWQYIGQQGRVLHLIPPGDDRYFYTACGISVGRASLRARTVRGAGGHCVRCVRAAARS